MITIQVKVTGHELSLISSPILSSDSIQFDRINFQFDSNWNGFNKVALFWGGDSDTPYGSLVDENNNATIPAEVIAEKGTIRFGVYGEDPENLRPRITSTILKYKVREGTWSDSVEGDDEVTETLIDQLKEIAYTAYGNAEQFIEDAQEYLTQAQTETAQNIAQNNAAVAANIQQNNAAIAEYIADARETTQEYLDEVTEMAEGAKDSAKVAAQAAIDAAAPCLTYSVLHEYAAGSPALLQPTDSVSVDDVGSYDYLEVVFRIKSYNNYLHITSKRIALNFGNDNYIDVPVDYVIKPYFTDINASPAFNHTILDYFVLRVNRSTDTISFLAARGHRYNESLDHFYLVGPGDNISYDTANSIPGYPDATQFVITKIIGWKYSNIASKELLSHDPELLDVRIAADGTIYASAGDAVRAHEDAIEEIEDVADDAFEKSINAYPSRSASGNPIVISDGANNVPVKALTVNIASQTGITGLSLTHSGKNLMSDTYDPAPVRAPYYKHIFVGNNTVTLSTTMPRNTNNSCNLFLLAGSVTEGANTVYNGVDVNTTRTVSAIDGYVTVCYRNADDVDPRDYNTQLEIGDAATDFEAYQAPDEYTVAFPSEAGSVTSGTLDIINGVLTAGGNTYQLDPIAIQTLFGWNVFYTNAGNISLAYRADPVLFSDSKYTKPNTGIPKTDLASDVQASLGKADTALQSAPVTSVAGKTGAVALNGNDVSYSVEATYSSGTVGKSLKDTEDSLFELQQTVDKLGGDKIPFDFSDFVPSEESIKDVIDGISDDVDDLTEEVTDLKSQIEEISQSGIDASGASDGQVPVADGQGSWAWDDPAGGVSDVQVNGVSVVSDGVANVPMASGNNPGVVKVNGAYGTQMTGNGKILSLVAASTSQLKAGSISACPVTPTNNHTAAFYGLAKAAGDTTQSSSSNAVGAYTESAKSAISEMLNGSVAVTGTTPSITALPGVRYVCGEVSTIDITVPATGIVDIVFTSGSTPTVLTVTPPTGMTMKWTNGFDPTALEANTVYEINIMDGEYGVVGTWT